MPSLSRIYLDNAATSWPKPEAVYRAIEHYQRHLGVPAGRSAYREAAEVERLIGEARRKVAQLIGASQPERVVFTANCTDSLNLALHGTLRAGDHVVTSITEHNSVLRPLRHLERQKRVQVTRVGCDAEGLVDPEDIRRAIRPNTKLISLIHASNVTGALQPVAEVAQIATQQELVFLIDAAQSLGHVPCDVEKWGAHLLAAPGHKGLLGPLGTGVLYVGPGAERWLQPIRQGGTGTQSESDLQPESLPDRYEAGNHNVPGILGLGAGAAFVQEQDVAVIRAHHTALTERLVHGLSGIRGVRVLGPRDPVRRVGVVSITLEHADPQEVASALDTAYGIQVRSGLHCAPLVHRALGTFERGGAVRFSMGVFNSLTEMDQTIDAIAEIAASVSAT